jgi:ABC-type amino acid transport substrate-binding protein
MNKFFLRFLPFMLMLSIVMSSCSLTPQTVPVPVTAPAPSATPTHVATFVPLATFIPSATSLPPLSDDVWDRIVANKKIVVGTAWDYPPFASVDSKFQVVGYDIALIREIGNRLNLPVEIQNFTFEGLRSALQINQIDLAVAAISITPERASQMTFSPVYYVNQTAILARADSAIPSITQINQMAAYRVGVQRGTTYQSWVQQSLVDARLMPASQLLSYMKAEDAVRDLEANRVDLVVLGQATASFYNSHQGLRMVGKGTDQQNLAVAMRLGTPRLKAEIDRVMGNMLTDGTILRLIQKYIQTDISGTVPTPIPPVQPTPTALPPIPTATPAACIDGMKFVADVTYGDNNMQNLPLLKLGEGFVKVWRLQNSGTCAWTPNYRLVYAYGNVDAAQMNGQPVSVSGNVTPGGVMDMSATLIAPQAPSIYQGFWQMENAKGERFGQTVWVGISTDPNAAILQPAGSYCEVTLTGPGRLLNVNEDFDAAWTVKNTSGTDWDMASVDYTYVSGTAMHKKATYDFPQTIKNGENGSIIVDMHAPDKAGTYSTQWAIVNGSRTLCSMVVRVTVK